MPYDYLPGLDHYQPSVARIQNRLLGGYRHFEADRAAVDEICRVWPNAGAAARAGRAFRHRAVRHLLEGGITQFLDVGSGMIDAGGGFWGDPVLTARVVYVDLDPIVRADAAFQLNSQGITNAAAVQLDLLRFPDYLFHETTLREHLDLSKPVGLLLTSVLHLLSDDDAYEGVAALRAALAPGSYLALCHTTGESIDPQALEEISRVYRRTTAPVMIARSSEQVAKFFDDYLLQPPGLVPAGQWRPDGEPVVCPGEPLAGVARKPD